MLFVCSPCWGCWHGALELKSGEGHLKTIPCDFPDGSCKELVRHTLGRWCLISALLRSWGWDGHLCFLRAHGVCGPGGGDQYVPKSVRQALSMEHFLNQTLLLPCAHQPELLHLYLLCWSSCTPIEGPDYIFGAFLKAKRKHPVSPAESESMRMVARLVYPCLAGVAQWLGVEP